MLSVSRRLKTNKHTNMTTEDRVAHWNRVYSTKAEQERSWYQPYPEASMKAVQSLEVPKDCAIIDVGGGDSYFVDALLDAGYTNVWVLDISAEAIHHAKDRLGTRAEHVHWIVSDVLDFRPDIQFDFWHDRAAFHFLVDRKDVEAYAALAERSIREGGHLYVGTFSDQGPKRCSGLDIHQYSEATMTRTFQHGFERLWCVLEDHRTPFDTIQNFLLCCFRKT